MLKLVIDQTAFDALPEAQKPLYKKDESGAYKLDVDPADIPDVDGLKRNNRELLEEKRREKERADAAELARQNAERERAKKDGDVAALETSWQTRLDTETGALKDTNTKLSKQLEALTVGRAATELAADLAVVTNGVSSAKALLPHIERRLAMEIVDGEPKVRVLDATGKPSAMTLDQLRDEFRADAAFAPLIRANGSGGSGGDGNKSTNGGGGQKTFAEMSEAERVKLHRENPAEFKRQSDAYKATQNASR